MKIGILSLQGDFSAHAKAIELAGETSVLVKKPEHTQGISGLILPGGESTTHIKLLERSGLKDKLFELAEQKLPMFGTCAGLILMAQKIAVQNQFCFGFLPICVGRNAYGSQKESFTENINIPVLNSCFECVFIRAPKIEEVYEPTQVLASFNNSPILVRHSHFLGATFHPELTEDSRIHALFLNICKNLC